MVDLLHLEHCLEGHLSSPLLVRISSGADLSLISLWREQKLNSGTTRVTRLANSAQAGLGSYSIGLETVAMRGVALAVDARQHGDDLKGLDLERLERMQGRREMHTTASSKSATVAPRL